MWIKSQLDFFDMPIPSPTPPPSYLIGNVLSLDAGNAASYPGSGSTWYDLSGNGANITLYNSPSYNVGGWITFNGSNQYGQSSNSALSVPGNNLSIEIWLNVGAGPYILFSKAPYYDNINDNNNYAFWYSTSFFLMTAFLQDLSDYTILRSNETRSSSTWYQIVMTYDGTNVAIYQNGTAISSFVQLGPTPLHSTGSPFRIGDPLNIGYGYLDGSIGVLNIWNTTLSSTDVTTNWDNYKSRFGY